MKLETSFETSLAGILVIKVHQKGPEHAQLLVDLLWSEMRVDVGVTIQSTMDISHFVSHFFIEDLLWLGIHQFNVVVFHE